MAWRDGLWPAGRLLHTPALNIFGGHCPPVTPGYAYKWRDILQCDRYIPDRAIKGKSQQKD